MGLISDSVCVCVCGGGGGVGGLGGGGHVFSQKKCRVGYSRTSPSSSAIPSWKLLCMMRNLCDSRHDAVSCLHVGRNQIGKVLTNQTDMDIHNIKLQVIFEN